MVDVLPATSPEHAIIVSSTEMSTGEQSNVSTLGYSTQQLDQLKLACEETAHVLSHQLGAECRLLIRPPYVIAGDLDQQILTKYHSEIVQPVEHALYQSLFRQRTEKPITILIFSSDNVYQRYADTLDGRNTANYYGYFERDQRRVVMNRQTGDGTLIHELTHAFIQADFPQLPVWFDEGLATLYEESDFAEGRAGLTGLPNWRLKTLQEGKRNGNLQTLEKLIASNGLRSRYQSLDYAHARYFCLYLQEQRLLSACYRSLRGTHLSDPQGIATLRASAKKKASLKLRKIFCDG